MAVNRLTLARFLDLLLRIGVSVMVAFCLGLFTCHAYQICEPLSMRKVETQRAISSPPIRQVDLNMLSVVKAVEGLRRIHTNSFETNIPAIAKPLISDLKQGLREVVDELLSAEGGYTNPQLVEAWLIEGLRQSGISIDSTECASVVSDDDNGFDYGAIYSITVQRPLDSVDLIAVTTTIAIPYGEDTSLYLFKYVDGKWTLILADEANGYDSITGAQSTFKFGISQPDHGGNFFVVTASVNPWPTSNWQRITYRVLRPGPNAFAPKVLLSHGQTIWLVDEPPYTLQVGDDQFVLSFRDEGYLSLQNDGEEIGIDDPRGKRFVRYRVGRDSVRPID